MIGFGDCSSFGICRSPGGRKTFAMQRDRLQGLEI